MIGLVMQKKHWISVFVVGGILFACLIFFIILPREPSYEGKRLSIWLKPITKEGVEFLIRAINEGESNEPMWAIEKIKKNN